MRFLLVKVLSDDHVYSLYARAIRQALIEQGHEATIVDLQDQVAGGEVKVDHLVRAMKAHPSDAVISFTSFFGAVQAADGRSLFDSMGVQFVGWQLDHPIYAPHGLARALRNRQAIYANPNHTRFVRALKLPGRGLTLLPGAHVADVPVKDFRDRTHGVFVAATFRGPPKATWETLEESPGKRLLTGVLERLSAHREASLLDAFNETAQTLDLNAELGVDPEFDDHMVAVLREPLTYLRNLDRLAVVLALARSDLPVTICGAGWRETLGERPNLTYLDEGVAFEAMPALYADAKVVVNLNAGNGACERALDAAAAGAAVVSDDSSALADLFSLDEISFFHHGRPGDVVGAAAELLGDEAGGAMAARGHRRILREGLWRHRVDQLVRFLQAA